MSPATSGNVEARAAAAARADVSRLVDGVLAARMLALIFLAATALVTLVLVLWAVLGGLARVEMVARLWPLYAVWMAGLMLSSRITAGEVRELVRADAMAHMAERGAALAQEQRERVILFRHANAEQAVGEVGA